MHKTLTLLTIVLVASAMVVSTFALFVIQKDIPGRGSIETIEPGIGLYLDQQCANVVSSVDFGLLEPGSSMDFTFYLKNEGNTDLSLNLTSRNWFPVEASEYMSLTWDQEGQQISPNQIIIGTIKLSVSPDIQDISSYSLTITINATG